MIFNRFISLLLLVCIFVCSHKLYAQTNNADSIVVKNDEYSGAVTTTNDSVASINNSVAITDNPVANTKDSVATTLQEVTVEASESTRIGNKSIYFPSKKLKDAMSTASQLLGGLQIPDLIVNPTNGTIAINDGGNISIRINGRPSSQTDLMTLSSKDITKIEYISNPGVRYRDVDAVVDITVKRKSQGYGAILNLLQSVNRGWGDYTGALKYNKGRSEWSLDYHSNPMWQMKCYRNNEETIDLGSYGFIYRTEKGIKTPNSMVTHRIALQYSYANKSGLLFNIQARLLRQNDRYANRGNITTTYNVTSSESREKEISPFKSWQVDLDIYLHWKINSTNKLYFNVVPTLVTSESNRVYENFNLSASPSVSSDDDVELSPIVLNNSDEIAEFIISSKIKNKGYILLSEGVWEGRIANGHLSGGIREIIRHSTSKYLTYNSNVTEKSHDSRCFFEWSQNLSKLRYSIGVEGDMYSLTSPISKKYFNVSPKLYLHYSPTHWGGMSFALDGNVVNPTLSQLTPITQRVDGFQYSEGNPRLMPYRIYKSDLEFDFNIRGIQGKISFIDKYSHKPIMGGKQRDGEKIIQSYYNDGFHNDFIIKGQLRTALFVPHFTLSLEGGWHKMVSRGINYRHAYSQPFINSQLMFMPGKWWFMIKYNNAYNVLWGEMISSVNNNLLNLGVGYRFKATTFMAGIVNPIGNISLKSRDLSKLAGYKRTYYVASTNSLLWIGATMNLYQGKRRATTQKKLENNIQYETIKNIQK